MREHFFFWQRNAAVAAVMQQILQRTGFRPTSRTPVKSEPNSSHVTIVNYLTRLTRSLGTNDGQSLTTSAMSDPDFWSNALSFLIRIHIFLIENPDQPIVPIFPVESTGRLSGDGRVFRALNLSNKSNPTGFLCCTNRTLRCRRRPSTNHSASTSAKSWMVHLPYAAYRFFYFYVQQTRSLFPSNRSRGAVCKRNLLLNIIRLRV